MNIIHQYIRNKDRRVIGVMLAMKINKDILIGWSKCNKLDRFDRARGLQIAIGRAETGSDVVPPRVVKKGLVKFIERADRFFNNPKPKKYNKTPATASHTY